MHSAPLHMLSRLLAAVRPGAPWSDHFNLSLIPLMSRDPPVVGARAPFREAGAAVFGEQTPPRADVISARTAAGGVAVVRLGAVLRGGMADRAVLRTTSIGGDGAVDLPVIPVESRWWGNGGVGAGGVLPAPVVSLVALATRGEVVARAAAQTAAWSAGAGDPGTVGRRVRGFMLLAGERAVALHVTSHDMAIAGGADPGAGGEEPRPTGAAMLGLVRGLIDRSNAVLTVDLSAPPLVEAWVLDAGGLLMAAT